MRVATPYRHPISGIYYFRRAVPEALRLRLNKTIIKVTLGTRNPNEAIQLFAARQIECEELFNAARNRCITNYHKSLFSVNRGSSDYQLQEGVILQYLFDKLNQEREVSGKTIDEAQKVIGRFSGVYKDIDAEGINGTIIREFKELLIKTPSILSDELRSLTLVQIVKEAGSEYSGRTLSDSAINKHLSVISSVLQWAANNSYFSNNWHNPVRGKTIKRKGLKQDRMPFTEVDLHKIFSSDIYTKQSRPKGGCGEAAYWIPIVGLYTGMRLEEIGQLLITDIKQESDIWYFDINDSGGKQLKNKSSIRRVPIHQNLLDLGFIDYIDSLEGMQLFPLLKKDKYGKLTQNWSKWFGRHIRRIGITDKSKVFHSYRHGLKDALRNADVDEAISDAITGHSSVSVGRSYGSGYNLIILNKAVQSVNYDIELK
jgi:integrase